MTKQSFEESVQSHRSWFMRDDYTEGQNWSATIAEYSAKLHDALNYRDFPLSLMYLGIIGAIAKEAWDRYHSAGIEEQSE